MAKMLKDSMVKGGEGDRVKIYGLSSPSRLDSSAQ